MNEVTGNGGGGRVREWFNWMWERTVGRLQSQPRRSGWVVLEGEGSGATELMERDVLFLEDLQAEAVLIDWDAEELVSDDLREILDAIDLNDEEGALGLLTTIEMNLTASLWADQVIVHGVVPECVKLLEDPSCSEAVRAELRKVIWMALSMLDKGLFNTDVMPYLLECLKDELLSEDVLEILIKILDKVNQENAIQLIAFVEHEERPEMHAVLAKKIGY